MTEHRTRIRRRKGRKKRVREREEWGWSEQGSQLTKHHTIQLPSAEAEMHWLLSLLIFKAFTGPLCSDIEDTSAWNERAYVCVIVFECLSICACEYVCLRERKRAAHEFSPSLLYLYRIKTTTSLHFTSCLVPDASWWCSRSWPCPQRLLTPHAKEILNRYLL